MSLQELFTILVVLTMKLNFWKNQIISHLLINLVTVQHAWRARKTSTRSIKNQRGEFQENKKRINS